MAGILYVVATPIGNLEDIIQRALRILAEVDYVLTEDTRVTARLLNHFGISTPTISYHQHSSEAKKQEILELLMQEKNLALVTDAGTPGISDPGNELIDFLIQSKVNINFVPVPGPSALTAILSVCGFRADKFIFVGFLPKKKRQKLFTWLKEAKMTFAFFDSPYRIKKTVQDLVGHFEPETRIVIARELTKIHETIYRGTLQNVANLLPQNIKGEVVVVVENC